MLSFHAHVCDGGAVGDGRDLRSFPAFRYCACVRRQSRCWAGAQFHARESGDGSEGFIKCGDEVIHIFNADGKADGIRTDALIFKLFCAEL